jgi:hypothetical protein
MKIKSLSEPGLHMKTGYRFTAQQLDNLRSGHLGQRAWNAGIKTHKCGHDAELYCAMPNGQRVCLGCKRDSGAKYRNKNRKKIRLSNRLGRYRLSRAQFKVLWKQQKGGCAICGKRLGRYTSKNPQCRIDHDHKTAAVRGLLCRSCNTAIGIFSDSIRKLRSAILYLQRPTCAILKSVGENTE